MTPKSQIPPDDSGGPAKRTGPDAVVPLSLENAPVNILLVDDEVKNLTVLETILNDPSYRLIRAESADQALLALVVEEFALLVLDINMPGMSGFELAKMIKQRKKTAAVPIIFLTAYFSETQHVLEGYETGAVDYLHKPVNPIILRSKVATFVELYRKNRECALANRALLSEVTERRRVQEQLVQLNGELERRVDERTAQLIQINSALSESERLFREMADSVPDIIFIAHPDGSWNYVNSRLQQLTGLSAAASLGNGWMAAIHADDKEKVQADWLGSAAAGNLFECHFRLRTLEGPPRWFMARSHPLHDGAGRIERWFGTVTDIHDLRTAEELLLEAGRQKDQFLSMLAHELRNPLAPIQTAVEIMRLPTATLAHKQTALVMIERQVSDLRRLLDDLLDVSRVTRGKIELRRERIALDEIVARAAESSSFLIDRLNHQLVVSLPPEPVWLKADPTRLVQVVSNLLNNAAKYTDAGGQVRLSAFVEGYNVVLRVEDNGIGISADLLPKIFDLFMQADTSLDRSHGGLGIGLTIVRRLVELHGGSVEAASDGLGRGSTFTVRLPIVSEVGTPENEPSANSDSAAPSSTLRILIVDDNKDFAHGLGMLLGVAGHTIRLAHDGAEALKLAEAFRPQVVSLDIGLPGLDGYEVARRLRYLPGLEEILVIAISGYGDAESLRRAREAGCDARLLKPVKIDELTDLIAARFFAQSKGVNGRSESDNGLAIGL